MIAPGYTEVLGSANSNATVTLWGSDGGHATTSRKGNYFRGEYALNNSTGAVWLTITNVGVLNQATNDIITNETGNVFVPRTPEALSYDPDGNLTNDGRWAYSWDAENRLIGMTTNTATGPGYHLTFIYDWMGRRIQKIVATNGVAYSTNDFVYDGWNLIAEAASTGFPNRGYLWGSDLSGGLHGAGGVGGLLQITYYGGGMTNCFVAYDGNGNVASLIAAADGTSSGQYEYGPFGEPVRYSGQMAKANPVRYSTKYQDDETSLLYYGYRYYDPVGGRWNSSDPIEEKGGPNIYEFSANSPESRIDKDGLATYDLQNDTYYHSIDFQPGDTVIFPDGSRVVIQAGNFGAITKYNCLLSKLGFSASPKFPIYWGTFNNGGTAWTLDYGIPSKRPTFFDKQRMDPPTTVNAELNSITVWHEIKGHNIDGAVDGPAFDATYEAPVLAAIKSAQSIRECMWCEPKDGSRRYVVPNRYVRFLCECGFDTPHGINK